VPGQQQQATASNSKQYLAIAAIAAIAAAAAAAAAARQMAQNAASVTYHRTAEDMAEVRLN
jgi:hypothetical protein